MKTSLTPSKTLTIAQALTFVLWGLIIMTYSPSGRAIEIGKPAPDFTLNTQSSSLSLQQFQGKIIYLDFWASWCGPCKQSFPWLNQMQSKYAQHGLQVIAINLDAKINDAYQFLQQHETQFIVAFDSEGKTPKNYGIKGMPSSVLISREGKVLAQHAGFRDSDKAMLEAHIQTALGLKK